MSLTVFHEKTALVTGGASGMGYVLCQQRIYLSGGDARSDIWKQMIANVFEAEVARGSIFAVHGGVVEPLRRRQRIGVRIHS